MKKLLLGSFFSGNELNVVDQKYVCLAKLFTETSLGAVLNSLQKFVGKGLAARVHDLLIRIATNNFIADGLKEMGFSKPGCGIEKERVIGTAGILGDIFSDAKG